MVESVILFGLFAKRDINEGSDVDIIVIAGFKEEFLDRIKPLLNLNDELRLPSSRWAIPRKSSKGDAGGRKPLHPGGH